MCFLSLMCLQQQKQKNFLVFLILRFILIEIIFIILLNIIKKLISLKECFQQN
jgi:hypothetical protein